MERSAYVALLQRWKWVLLMAAWVAGLVGFLNASNITPTYEANARLLVGPVNTDVTTVRAAESLTLTYAEIATTEPTLRRVTTELGLDIEPADLANDVSVVATSSTRILSIRATGSDPAQTALIANTLADEMIEMASADLDRPEGRMRLIDPAVVPSAPISPNVLLITMLAAIAGFLAAGLLATAAEYFGNTVKGAAELADMTSSSVLGEVNVNHGYQGTPVQPLVVEAQPESRIALAYRLLASRLPLGGAGDAAVRSILVVGSQTGEEVGELTANLAAVLARTGRSVTLIDADDLEANVSNMFVPDWRTGLADILGRAPEAVTMTDVLDSIRVERAPGIELIPAGNSESLTAREDTVAALLETLTTRSDLVLISGAPIHRSAQSLLWARHADGVVLVASVNTTRVENVRYAIDSLRLVGARVLGGVLLVHKATPDRWRWRRSTRGATRSASLPSSSMGADVHPRSLDARIGSQVSPPGTTPAERPAVGDKGLG